MARFWVEGQKVLFAWDPKLRDVPLKQAAALRDCILEVSESSGPIAKLILRERKPPRKPVEMNATVPIEWSGNDRPVRKLSLKSLNVRRNSVAKRSRA